MLWDFCMNLYVNASLSSTDPESAANFCAEKMQYSGQVVVNNNDGQFKQECVVLAIRPIFRF